MQEFWLTSIAPLDAFLFYYIHRCLRPEIQNKGQAYEETSEDFATLERFVSLASVVYVITQFLVSDLSDKYCIQKIPNLEK